MHGLADGEIRGNSGEMAVIQAEEGPDENYPDGLTTDETIKQLDLLAKDDKPFFLAFGILRPHLPFGAPAKYLEPYKEMKLPPVAHPEKPDWQTTWHKSGEFMKYQRWGKNPNEDPAFSEEVRKYYAACVTYADAQVGRVLEALEKTGQSDNTIVVLWGDHGWHLGEHAIWGKHCLFEEALRSPLIVVDPRKKGGKAVDTVVETVDVFPTLCSLTGVETPDYAIGDDLLSSEDASPFALGYHRGRKTIRTDTHRLIEHKGGYHELYDHRSAEAETKNVAEEHPEIGEKLKALIKKKHSRD